MLFLRRLKETVLDKCDTVRMNQFETVIHYITPTT